MSLAEMLESGLTPEGGDDGLEEVTQGPQDVEKALKTGGWVHVNVAGHTYELAKNKMGSTVTVRQKKGGRFGKATQYSSIGKAVKGVGLQADSHIIRSGKFESEDDLDPSENLAEDDLDEESMSLRQLRMPEIPREAVGDKVFKSSQLKGYGFGPGNLGTHIDDYWKAPSLKNPVYVFDNKAKGYRRVTDKSVLQKIGKWIAKRRKSEMGPM